MTKSDDNLRLRAGLLAVTTRLMAVSQEMGHLVDQVQSMYELIQELDEKEDTE